jgi:hypothetical protein
MGSESLRGVLVRGAGSLRVDGEREARIGVPEARLGGLQIDSREDQSSRVARRRSWKPAPS